MTGLEVVLAPALGKVAGTGAARVAGWGAQDVMSRRRRRKIRALTHSRARADQLNACEALDDAQLQNVAEFCESLEMEHVAASLARAFLLENSGRAGERFAKQVRAEFDAAFGLWMGESHDPLVGDAIFGAISEAVTHCVTPLLNRPKLPVSLEAELLATVGSVSAASVRNTELLTSLGNLQDIRAFEIDFKSQVGSLHATMRLPHAGTTRQVPYDQLFVQPRVRVELDPERTEGRTRNDAVDIDALLCHTPRVVLLGDPGGGKSTLSRKLIYDIAADRLPKLTGRVPFLIELRDYASAIRGRSRKTLVEYMEDLCRSPYHVEAPENAIEYLLLNDKAMVVLDGLDELLDVSLRRDVVEAVEGFAHRFPMCPVLVTSRRVGYSEAALNDALFETATLSEFSMEQVDDYVGKWFELDESVEPVRQAQLASSFVADSQFVADLRVNPLMLSLMCGIYASENYIPRNRPDVYEKCALMLFESWDKQRGIMPELPFDAHVQSALRALALHMFELESTETLAKESGDGVELVRISASSEGMGRTELIQFFTKYLREKRFDNDEDAESAAVEFLDFCKGRAWVLTDVGSETYGFTHRTFLEYFAASQLVRLNTSADALYASLRSDISSGGSDVVAQLAVQILGRTTEDGADDFLNLVVQGAAGDSSADVHAVSFAARALNFVVPRPAVLKDVCRNAVRLGLKRSMADPSFGNSGPLAELFSCSTENAPRVAAALRDELDALLAVDAPSERACQLAYLHGAYGYASSGTTWRTWTAENWSRYPEARERAQRGYFWLAVMSFESGDASLADLLDWHGVAALHDFKIDGNGDRPPFVYRFIRMRERGGYSSLGHKALPKSRYTAVANELLEELPKRPAPWLVAKDDYHSSAWALRRIQRDSDIGRAARVLTVLPLLELEDEQQPSNLFVGADLVFAARAARAGVPDEVRAMFADWPSALNLVERWIAGEVNLLRRPRPRSRAANTKRRQARAARS